MAQLPAALRTAKIIDMLAGAFATIVAFGHLFFVLLSIESRIKFLMWIRQPLPSFRPHFVSAVVIFCIFVLVGAFFFWQAHGIERRTKGAYIIQILLFGAALALFPSGTLFGAVMLFFLLSKNVRGAIAWKK